MINTNSTSKLKGESKPMQINMLTLAFTGQLAALEKPFLNYYVNYTLPHIRITLLMGLLMYGGFGVLDALLIPNEKVQIWLIRYGLVCPFILATLGTTYIPCLLRFLQPIMSALIAIGGFGIVMMIIIAPTPFNYYYYAGLILVFIYGYGFIYLRFVWASLSGWFIVILYELVLFNMNTPSTVVISNNFFFLSANISCMLVAYYIEYANRKSYFLMYLLEEEQKKIQETNAILELRVAERTEELELINKQLNQKINDYHRAEGEKRNLQERLQRAEKMEALGTLAGGVAHDLNNVLGVVVGYAELLLNDGNESRKDRQYLLNIMNGGERAAAIVQDLLTLARRGVSVRKVLNLNSIISDSENLPEFKKMYSFHLSVKIQTDLDPNLLNIAGSSVHLSKTLFNLISNACESMPNGGTVTITTSNQYLDAPIRGYDEVKEGDYVVLKVSDTGIGISQTDLKHIFEPFYTKKIMGRSGTGLGLAVVWGTVKDHGGYIDIHSEAGKGSVFTLYFPATRQEISTKALAVPVSELLGRGESIVVVDDIKEQRDLATEMLRKLNYSVTNFSSGEEAVEYLREHKTDLLILDMIMEPGMDGLDTYKNVIELYPKQKAIIVSGFSETERIQDAQALGAGTYVKKPYIMEKLGLAVRKELDRPI